MKKIELKTKIILLILLAIAIMMPIILGKDNNYYVNILISFCYFSILAASLNLLIGYSGQISLGHAAFMSIGAYTYAILTKTFDVHFLLAIVAALIIAFLSGIILGMASSKLGAIYLAIATVGFANTINLIIINEGWLTGGANGFVGIKRLTIFGYELSNFELYYVALLVTLIVFLITYRIINSKTGRAIQAISNAPIAASSMGINVNTTKLLIAGISAAMAGMAGVLYALTYRYLSADMFAKTSITLITMTVVGGMGSLFGPLLGAVSIGIIPELLRSYSNYVDGIYGILIILAMLFLPNGIAGGLRNFNEWFKETIMIKRKKEDK